MRASTSSSAVSGRARDGRIEADDVMQNVQLVSVFGCGPASEGIALTSRYRTEE